MTEKELRSLSKAELIGLLREREAELNQTLNYNKELDGELNRRKLTVDNAGSIAEASLKLNDVFKAAQESADMYLEGIRELEEKSRADAERIEDEARKKTDDMLLDAEKRCAERELHEKQYVEGLWIDLQERLIQFSKAHAELSELVRQISLFSLPPSERQGAEEQPR